MATFIAKTRGSQSSVADATVQILDCRRLQKKATVQIEIINESTSMSFLSLR